MHIVQSIVPNAPKMYDDLKFNVPQTAVRVKLELWTTKWKEEIARAKRARDTLAPSILPKCVKSSQNTVLDDGSSQRGIERIMQTLYNHLCAHIDIIPYQCVKKLKHIESYGSCS